MGSNPTSGIEPHSASVKRMCGRFTLTRPDPDALRLRFDLPADAEIHEEPRFNISPTTEVLAVRAQPLDAAAGGSEGVREVGRLRWGLVPHFADPDDFDRLLINARSETVAEKPSFRSSFAGRRCLVLADGFYEWKRDETGKHPYFFSRPGREPFAFAAIWDRAERSSGEPLFSCSLITCEASSVVEPVHDRMPVILDGPEGEAEWLAHEADPDALTALMRPTRDLEAREVDEAVNSSRVEGPQLLEPPLRLT